MWEQMLVFPLRRCPPAEVCARNPLLLYVAEAVRAPGAAPPRRTHAGQKLRTVYAAPNASSNSASTDQTRMPPH
jgi:hypothetical protein